MLHLAALELPLPPLPRSCGSALESKSIHVTIKEENLVWVGASKRGAPSPEPAACDVLPSYEKCICMVTPGFLPTAYSSPNSFQPFDDLSDTLSTCSCCQMGPEFPPSCATARQQSPLALPARAMGPGEMHSISAVAPGTLDHAAQSVLSSSLYYMYNNCVSAK